MTNKAVSGAGFGLALGAWAWFAAGPAPAAVPAPPRLVIEPAGRVDLGVLGPEERKVQRYSFRNRSPGPIALRVLDLAPGVTAAGPALERPIAGQAAAALEVRVDASGWEGPQLRGVRLGTDDPAQGDYYLPLRMTIRPDLTVDGPQRDLGTVAPRESPEAVFRFRRETGAPLALRLVGNPPPYLQWDCRCRGPEARLGVVLRAAAVPPGMRQGFERLRVESNAPLQPDLDLYLVWRLRRPIEAEPPRLVFGGGAGTLALVLRCRAGTPFRILDAAVAGGGFRVEGSGSEPAPVQEIQVFRAGPGPAQALLVLRCSGEPEPVRVPLVALNEDVIVEAASER
jgi:hypothetical protein